ncbi:MULTISPECIES: hypothetical protein [unclassified Desulfovibrio]|uniref:hypothetical protein n=1 Tax=unclassified Desulfovibrio TaxID=2593640 RepID=UPI002FD9C4D8
MLSLAGIACFAGGRAVCEAAPKFRKGRGQRPSGRMHRATAVRCKGSGVKMSACSSVTGWRTVALHRAGHDRLWIVGLQKNIHHKFFFTKWKKFIILFNIIKKLNVIFMSDICCIKTVAIFD